MILCAQTATLALGCGDAVREPLLEPVSPGAAMPDATPTALVGCAPVQAADPWWNQTFADQTGVFHAEFDATPSTSAIDAVVGLGNGAASGFTQLAAIVRFNTAGTIDARSGSTYRADVVRPYEAGTRYHFRLDINTFSRTYSVWLRNAAGTYDAIARGYSFRTEQAGVTRLNNGASKVDSADGALEVCGLFVIADASTAPDCVVALAGDGFVNAPLTDATVLDTVTFSATPSAPGIDAVIGLSAGPAARFTDLAAAVRFAPSGALDVRDGDGYRADTQVPYDARSFDFRVIADVTSRTYSVFQGVWSNAQELARQYRFRTQQSGATHLDQLAVIVDGDQGSVSVCRARAAPSTGVAYSREGRYSVVPLAGGDAVISDGATIMRLDSRGQVVAQVARAGRIAADASGNVFAASITGTALTVDKYDANLAPVWTASWTVLAGSSAGAIAVAPDGGVLASAISPADHMVMVTRFTAAGTFTTQLAATGDAVTIDGDQPIVAWYDGSTLRIRRFDASGATVWAKEFAGQAGITAMTVDPDHNLVFGGELFTAMDFGGGTLPLRQTDNGRLNAFVVKLSAAGEHVFSLRTGYTHVGGIATDGARVLVSGTWQTQFHYWQLQTFDAAGNAVPGPAFNTGFGEDGFGGAIAIGPTGRVWWNTDTQWPFFPRWPYLVVIDG
jgi:hypothetical protein